MREEIALNIEKSNNNVIVEGSIASGKTTNVVFPVIKKKIENEESFLILDSKEEYINKYYDSLKTKGYNVIILNFQHLDKSEGWNPLELPYKYYKKGNKDKATELTDNITNTIMVDEGSNDPFWINTARDFTNGIILALYEDAEEDEVNFNSVYYSMMNASINNYNCKKDNLTAYFEQKEPLSPANVYVSNTLNAPRETKGSILAVAKQKIRLFTARELLSKLLSKTTFDYESIKNDKTAIFVIGKLENNSYMNTIAELFIRQMYDLLEENKGSSFNFILDNIDSLDNLNWLSGKLNSSLQNNVRSIILTRSLDRLKQYDDRIIESCDIVKTDGNQVELCFSGETIKLDKSFIFVDCGTANISYPKFDDEPVKIFDVKNKVNTEPKTITLNDGREVPTFEEYCKNRDNKLSVEEQAIELLDKMDAEDGIKKPDKEDFSIPELIERIDKKIEQLEGEELLKDYPFTEEGFLKLLREVDRLNKEIEKLKK